MSRSFIMGGFSRQPRGARTPVRSYMATDGFVSVLIEHIGRPRLWTVRLRGVSYSNSLLGDLADQLKGLGYTVKRCDARRGGGNVEDSRPILEAADVTERPDGHAEIWL